MIDNLIYQLQIATLDQLKSAINKNMFVGKDLGDFNKGKEVIDNLLELNKTNVDDLVKYTLILYFVYKIKGGK